MDFFQALIFGIVEGITEFLPISSTGHLMLTAEILKIPQSEFVKSFEIAIQSGAILAVVALYGKMLWKNFEVMKRVAVAFAPTAVIGFLLYKIIKQFLLGNNTVVLWALGFGGILLILFEIFHKENSETSRDLKKMSYSDAFMIGVCQSVAVVPGVSRSAATIVGGLLCGLDRKSITEFSFLLAVPTMAAATGFDLMKNASAFSFEELDVLAIGFISAFVVALFSIKFLLQFIKTHTFIPFGIYRLIAAFLFWKFAL